MHNNAPFISNHTNQKPNVSQIKIKTKLFRAFYISQCFEYFSFHLKYEKSILFLLCVKKFPPFRWKMNSHVQFNLF